MSGLVRNYHLMFTRIKNETYEAIQQAVENGLWDVDEDEGFNIIRELYSKLSGIYDIPAPTLIEARREYYIRGNETIGLPKVSLVSCLHEYRHHMQKHGRQHYDDIEVDARAWSISAFKNALPDHFDRAWRNGWIWFMPEYQGDN